MNLRGALLGVGLLLAGCAGAPTTPVAGSAAPAVAAQARVAAIRAAAGPSGPELDIRPLRDPMVEDLRRQAVALEQAGRNREAAAALDEAIARNPEDPALLQERAEAAVLLGQLADAERFARQAIALGAQVGPLCRRHWATIVQARDAASDAAGAAQARGALDACRLAPPPRY